MAFTPKQRKAALEKGLTVDLASSHEKKYVKTKSKRLQPKLFAGTTEESPATEALPADHLPGKRPPNTLFFGRRSTGTKSYRP